MAELAELLEIEGVVAAGEWSKDGAPVAYASKIELPTEDADVAARFCATVSMMFEALGPTLPEIGEMPWGAQQGWAYCGGTWTVAVGANGRKGVFVETARADFNVIFGALLS
jgi:roadblock/LC7 domain-containing protein